MVTANLDNGSKSRAGVTSLLLTAAGPSLDAAFMVSEEIRKVALSRCADGFWDVREENKSGLGLELVDGYVLPISLLFVVEDVGRARCRCSDAGSVEAYLHDALVVPRRHGAGDIVVVLRIRLVTTVEKRTCHDIQRISTGNGFPKVLDLGLQVIPL